MGLTRRTFCRGVAVLCLTGAEILQLPGRPQKVMSFMEARKVSVAKAIEKCYRLWLTEMDPVWRDTLAEKVVRKHLEMGSKKGASGVTDRDGP